MQNAQPVTRGMRLFFWAAAILVAIAGFQLYYGAEQTDVYFAWTINPPLTAAFLGAGYWSVFLSSLLALRESYWVRVRGTIPTAVIATGLLLVATLLHLDRFHTDSPVFITWFAAWAWIVVYVVAPPLVLLLIWQQLRILGATSPRQYPLPSTVRTVLLIISTMTIAPAIVFVIAPEVINPIWPWMLTPLTGRAVGAWLAAVGSTTAVMWWENDFARLRLTALAVWIFGALQLLAMARFASTVDWGNLLAWVLVILWIAMIAVGLYIWLRGRWTAV
jgi:hypothetical protein